MKLLVDLYPCQTPSRLRGIGRLALSLGLELARQRGSNEMTVLADALYPGPLEDLRRQFIRLLPAGSFLPYYHLPYSEVPPHHAPQNARLAESLIEQAYQAVDPDVVFTPSFFEGWGGLEPGWVPVPSPDHARPLRAVFLHDLIPYIFHERYLDHEVLVKDWYLGRMHALRNFDLVLTNSEATRQDGIRLLDLDPTRVVTVGGASSSHFRKLDYAAAERQAWLQRLGITRPFVLYIGGNDLRKNMDGALRGYARLPRALTSTHQLVLNDIGDAAVFRARARSLGLADEDLVINARWTDEELEALYNLCKLFFFPSQYEGLGLPMLEAMTCGAPVIASNVSSMPGVIGRGDAVFDVSRDAAVTMALEKALTDDRYRSDLAAYGPKRAAEFTWSAAARRAWAALEELAEGMPAKAPAAGAPSSKRRRLRLAHVSPLPPQKSGVGEYSAALLPYLARHFDIDLFADPNLKDVHAALKQRYAVYPWTELLTRRDDYDCVLYQMGNSELNIPMMDLLQELPGVVVSHDFFTSNLPYVKEMWTRERGLFQAEMDYSHGLHAVLDYLHRGADAVRWDWPMNWRVLKYAQEIVVHSPHQIDLMAKYYGRGWYPTPTLIRQFRDAVPSLPDGRRRRLRKELRISPDAFAFCSFGFMSPTKLSNDIILAFSRARARLQPNTRLVFVGDLEGAEYGQETLRLLEDPWLKEHVSITGYLSMEEFEKYLACADVAVQLRANSRGETSRALLDCLAHGLPAIVNPHGSFNDYGEQEVLRISELPSQEELADALVLMQSDDALRAEKSRRARTLIAEQHDPTKAAEAYANVILRAVRRNEKVTFKPLVDAMSDLGAPDALLVSAAKLAAANAHLRTQPRILLDLSGMEDLDRGAPARRRVAEVARGLAGIENTAIHVDLVHRESGKLVRACRMAEEILGLPEESLGEEHSVEGQPGDVLVLLSDLAGLPSGPGVIDNLRGRGGRIIALVAEQAPTLPKDADMAVDAYLCSSAKSARDLRQVAAAREGGTSRDLNIFHVDGHAPGAAPTWEDKAAWFLDTTRAQDLFKVVSPVRPTAGQPVGGREPAPGALEAFRMRSELATDEQSVPGES